MILFTLINFAHCLTTIPSVISDIFYHRQAAIGGVIFSNEKGERQVHCSEYWMLPLQGK